jgi:hypothetical protein
VPTYVDHTATLLLEEARAGFAGLDLARRSFVPWGRRLPDLPVGRRPQADGLTLSLLREGLRATPDGVAILVEEASETGLREALARIADGHGCDPVELACRVGDRTLDKFDRYLDEGLTCGNYASRMIDTDGLAVSVRNMLG